MIVCLIVPENRVWYFNYSLCICRVEQRKSISACAPSCHQNICCPPVYSSVSNYSEKSDALAGPSLICSNMTARQFYYETRLFKYIENFTSKTENFSDKKLWQFSYFCSKHSGYSLEPPRWGGSNEYPQSKFFSRNKKNYVYPYRPRFYYIKVGFKGVKII